MKNKNGYEQVRLFFRFIGLLAIFTITIQVGEFYEDSKSFVISIAKDTLISTEYFNKSHCVNVLSIERSADIGRGNISVYNTQTGKFETRKCKLSNVQ